MSQSHTCDHSDNHSCHHTSDGMDPSTHPVSPFQVDTPRPAAGIFDLARLQAPPAGWALAILPAMVAWLGGVAFLGQFRSNQIAAAIAALMPLGILFWICLAGSGAAFIITLILRRRGHAVLWAAVTGYLAGHVLFASLPIHHAIEFRIPFTSTSDGLTFVKHRLVYGACVSICTAAAMLLAASALRSRPTFHLGVGSWSTVGRDFTHKSKPETYRQAMLGFIAFAAILWVVGQMSVELKPLRTGLLWGLIPAILIAALANAFIEEIIYRGLLQPAFIHAAGIARGLWIQGLMFGLLHWGLSIGAVAALPTSLLIGIGSVFWGKAVLETRGLSWVIIAHALVDVAIMCAYFVPRS